MIPGLMLAGIYIVYLLGLGVLPSADGAGGAEGGARPDQRRRARRQAAARGAAADRAGRRRARLDHRRHRGADRGRLDGRARRHRGDRDRRPHVMGGPARHHLHDHPHHRDDDVHPDLRAGVLARLPRAAGRAAGSGLLRVPAGRHERRDLVPDVHHLHSRLLHRVDRDFLHRGPAVPAGVHRRRTSTWCGSRR